MEMKAVKEYQEPEYPTKQESKNRIIEMIARSSKISLGLALMCILYNVSFASNLEPFLGGIAPIYYYPEPLLPIQQPIIPLQLAIFPLVITAITTIIFQIKYKKCADEEKKLKLKKRRNIALCIGMVVTIIFVILSFIKI